MDKYQLLYMMTLFFQTLHIFEEIYFEAYQIAGTLQKYLRVASGILFISFLPLVLMLMDLRWGIYLGLLPSSLAILNGIVHVGGWIKTRSYQGTLGGGIFSGIPLSISGILTLISLLAQI